MADLISLQADVDSLTVELLNRYEEITLLYDLAQDMGTVLDFEEASRTVLTRSLQVIPAEIGLVLVGATSAGLTAVVTCGEVGSGDGALQIARAAAAEVMRRATQLTAAAGDTLEGGITTVEPVLAAPLQISGSTMTETAVAGVLVFVGRSQGGLSAYLNRQGEHGALLEAGR